MARVAQRRGGRIAYVPRAAPARFLATGNDVRPLGWTGFGNFPDALLTATPANIRGTISVPRTGTYHAWVEGSFARWMTIGLDGRALPDWPSGLNNPGAYASLGSVRLTGGRHELFIRQGGADLRPGSGGYRSSLRHLGPLFLSPVADERLPVRTVAARDWRRLVGVRADWLEVVG
jgi:hypothetical protein